MSDPDLSNFMDEATWQNFLGFITVHSVAVFRLNVNNKTIRRGIISLKRIIITYTFTFPVLFGFNYFY